MLRKYPGDLTQMQPWFKWKRQDGKYPINFQNIQIKKLLNLVVAFSKMLPFARVNRLDDYNLYLPR